MKGQLIYLLLTASKARLQVGGFQRKAVVKAGTW